jgi:LysR family glycine cleavage system transcriptional activator
MRRKLPPLKSLLAFEAVGRHLSITKAADELCVTPAAVSYHIKSLEDWLGTPLFRSERRAIALTDVGRAYRDRLTLTLDDLAAASDSVRTRDRKQQLALVVPPSFAMKWLLPRLKRFRERRPDIEIVMSVSAAVSDCTHESTDFAIHYGIGTYANLSALRLIEVELFPVCRPKSLLDGRPPPKHVDDLAGYTLLHDDMLRVNEGKDWRYWLQMAGSHDPSIAERGLHFNQAALAYEAAIQGHGVALAKNVLVSFDLETGRLVRPFNLSCKTGLFYWALCRESRANEPRIVAFRDWLMDEMASAAA